MSSSPTTPQPGDERRRHDRALVHSAVQSSLGPVVDLSMSGARIACRIVPEEGVIPIEVGDEHGSFRCAARIAWSRRCGIFRWEVGVLFPCLDAAGAETLRRLLANHRFDCEYGQAA